MKYFLILLTIIILSVFWVWFGIYIPKEPWSVETEIFLVKRGEGAREISFNLKSQGFIRYSSLFRIYALFKEKQRELKAGEYELGFSMNIPEIVEKMAEGERIRKIITIIEGWAVKDIEQYLGESIDSSLEGYLFPDTYEISPEADAKEIVEKMRENFEKKLTPELREKIEEQKKTIVQIITMASLLEKEVKTPEDKKIVSGILWKRIENNMPLQVDATIVYVTGRKSLEITKEELKIDSPYNTYKYKGLPPGPICNPGIESIKAAIYPEKSEYWFYLSTKEGKTIFSRNLKEHNEAKNKYLD